MLKKDFIEKVKNEIADVGGHIPSYIGEKELYYSMSKDRFKGLVKEIEEALSQNKDKEQTELYSELQHLLCAANFGEGFTEGLFEMKQQTYRNRYRSFSKIASIVEDLNSACLDVKETPNNVAENHLRLGKAYGLLGFTKDVKMMLETSTYLSNIREYAKNA